MTVERTSGVATAIFLAGLLAGCAGGYDTYGDYGTTGPAYGPVYQEPSYPWGPSYIYGPYHSGDRHYRQRHDRRFGHRHDRHDDDDDSRRRRVDRHDDDDDRRRVERRRDDGPRRDHRRQLGPEELGITPGDGQWYNPRFGYKRGDK